MLVRAAMEEEMAERERQDKRHQKRFTKRCEVEFLSEGVKLRGISGNFSLNGLFIRTNHPAPLDSVLDVAVFLPNDTTSCLKVRVVRAYKTPTGKVMGTPVRGGTNGMGVRIIEKDANYLNFFKSILSDRKGHDDIQGSTNGKDAHHLLETKDGKVLSTIEIVAVLTKVVKQQQKSLTSHREVLETLTAAVARLDAELTSLKKRV
jgi:hypothetical protein